MKDLRKHIRFSVCQGLVLPGIFCACVFGPGLLSISNQTRINLPTMIADPNNNIALGYSRFKI